VSVVVLLWFLPLKVEAVEEAVDASEWSNRLWNGTL